jgi:predicted O-methyltransferase YrrM
MRRFTHWTPRYIKDRLNVIAYERRHPDVPWLTRDMIQILESWLRPDDQGLEWGSGRSTLWFAQRIGRLLSVEHDERWYSKIKNQIESKGMSNVDYRLCENEAEYVSVAEKLANESLDIVLVDGIARDRCACVALPLLRPNGILVIDNSNWYLPSGSHAPNSRRLEDGPASRAWGVFLNEIKGWRCIRTTNGVSDTTLWVKAG